MKFEENLRKQMLLKGFNQQKLARLSGVSDSEISRILKGKSTNPGLENALRLARALGVSLDYLAGDEIDQPSTAVPPVPEEPAAGVEQEVLEAVRELGARQARRILETVLELGYEVAIRRLLDMKPLIEVGEGPARPSSASGDRRASSA